MLTHASGTWHRSRKPVQCCSYDVAKDFQSELEVNGAVGVLLLGAGNWIL